MGNPYTTGFPFGTGNFPTGANPWSGQTAAVADGLAFYTPGTALQAEGLNYRFNQIENAILYNAAAVGAFNLVGVTNINIGNQGWTASSFVSGNTVTVATFPCQAGDMFEVISGGVLAPVGPASGYPQNINGTVSLTSKDGAGSITTFGTQITANQYSTSSADSNGVPGSAFGFHTVGTGVTSWTLGINGYVAGGTGVAEVVYGLPGFNVKQYRANP